MTEVSVIIPNYNGMAYIRGCLDALQKQTLEEMEVIVVDNGSKDGSPQVVAHEYPQVHLISLDDNYGFCKAVNVGIRAAASPYVILLNNDTQAEPDFCRALLQGIQKSRRRFSCCAKMIQFHDRTRLDDAGNFYSALGWAFARGRDKPVERYDQEGRVFSCCAGAAIYRRQLLVKMGGFDEEHFAYLEDMDVGYKARIQGYVNVYVPDAVVYHVGSGTSGSRYNLFKIRYSSRNNIYLIYKNMPILQIILNLPFLIAGFGMKLVFFTLKGYGREYAAGIKNGFQLCRKEKKVRFQLRNLPNYCRIQIELWANIFRRFRG